MCSEKVEAETSRNVVSSAKNIDELTSNPAHHFSNISDETKSLTKADAIDSMGSEKNTAAHFDEVLRLVGGTGRWQLLLYLWMSTVFLSTSFAYLGLMFLGATPDFRCADGYPENATFREIPEAVPQCYSTSGAPCQRWQYDLDTDGDGEDDAGTVVSKWNLVCDRKVMLSALQSALQGGGLVASLVAGQLGDYIGRRRVYLVMCFLYVAAPLASTVVGSYEAYFVMRVLLGMGWVGVVNMGSVLVVELSDRSWRATAGQLMMLPHAFGQMALSALAYSFRNWWQLQLVLNAPWVIYILNVWVIPESPRWLILQGRDNEAISVLTTASRVNGRERPNEDTLRRHFDNMRRCERVGMETRQGDNVRSFFSSATLRRWTTVAGLCWFAIGAGYYGLQFDVSKLSYSPYVACGLLGLVTVPSHFSSCLLNRCGRRPVMVGTLTLAGIAMLFFTVKRDPVAWLALGLFGKLMLGITYSMVYTYTPEHMPTTVRTIGLGFASVCAQIGAMVSPFIVDLLRDIDVVVPSVVFGCTCILAGLAARTLPETVDRHLPDTVAELEAGVLDLPVSRVSSTKESRQ